MPLPSRANVPFEPEIVSCAENIAQAVQQSGERMHTALAYLENSGVAKSELQTDIFNLSPEWFLSGTGEPYIVGFVVSRQVCAVMSDSRILGSAVDNLVDHGVERI